MQHLIEFTLIERTVRRVWIEAETIEEAIETVEEYAFDNGDAWQVDSLQWEVDNVVAVAT